MWVARFTFDYHVSEIKRQPAAVTADLIDSFLALKRLASTFLPGYAARKLGPHVELEYPYLDVGANDLDVHLNKVWPTEASFQAPVFDMVFTSEAQCEYLLSMKPPAAKGEEGLTVVPDNIGSGYKVTNWGDYQPIYLKYSQAVDKYCLYRHAVSNLPLVSGNYAVLIDNVSRFIHWTIHYLQHQ